MPPVATSNNYSSLAKWFHWLIAAAIVVQYVLAELAEDADSALAELALLAQHKSVGISILALAVLRLAWRFTHSPPPLPNAMPRWQVFASHASHSALYVALFALPLTGWLLSSASAYSVSWFNWIQLPDLIAPNEAWADWLADCHEWLGKGLFVIALLHIAAALKHALVDKDGVLVRMSSIGSVSGFVIVLVGGVWWLTDTGSSRDHNGQSLPKDDAIAADAVTIASDLPLWAVDYEASEIRFSAVQAGASFEGVWDQWQAKIQFDPEALATSVAEVRVDVSAVSTGDSSRDDTLQENTWFDSNNHPEAVFTTQTIRLVDDGFEANGLLEIKGLRTPVILAFTVQRQEEQLILEGSTKLDRLVLQLGTGDWQDTTWVGQFVNVSVRVVASLPPT